MRRAILCAAALGGLLCLAMPAAAEIPASVAQLLTKYRIPSSAVRIEVRALVPAGTPLPPPILSVNPKRRSNPASAIKLVTTLAALEILGGAHRWETEYLTRGELIPGADGDPGVLRGDLILRGGGDPLLTVEQIFTHILALRERIAAVDGELIIDNARYAPSAHRREEFDGQSTRLYNVAPDATLLNFSATNFILQPHAGRLHITASPPLDGLTIINEIQPQSGRCINRNAGWNHKITRQDDQIRAHFHGQYRMRCGEHIFARSILPNGDYACRLFIALWRMSGGAINGCRATNRVGAFADAQIFLTRESQSLAEIITGVNKFSNNVMARILLLTLGEYSAAEPAPAGGRKTTAPPHANARPSRNALRARGRAVIYAWLREHSIAMPKLKIDNGAGLSRRSRVSARGLSELLQHGWRSVYRPEFLASLPLAAMDGTLRSRMQSTPLPARARIKTGLLDGVRSMAGYVQAADDRHYSVVMMIDTLRVNFWNGNELQDALLEWVYNLP